MELEKKVLEGLIQMLDEQEGEKLKKHPKLMAMEVEIEKKPKMEEMEEPEMESEDDSEMELTPELIQKLLEMSK
jgi:hypothetical protein